MDYVTLYKFHINYFKKSKLLIHTGISCTQYKLNLKFFCLYSVQDRPIPTDTVNFPYKIICLTTRGTNAIHAIICHSAPKFNTS